MLIVSRTRVDTSARPRNGELGIGANGRSRRGYWLWLWLWLPATTSAETTSSFQFRVITIVEAAIFIRQAGVDTPSGPRNGKKCIRATLRIAGASR